MKNIITPLFGPKRQYFLKMRRFYFRNWHGLNNKDPMVSRYASQTGSDHGAAPLLEITALEYLFAQVSF